MGVKSLLMISVLLLLSSLDGACLPSCRGNGISGRATDPLVGLPVRDAFDIVPFNITKGMTKKQVLAVVEEANVLGLWQWDLPEKTMALPVVGTSALGILGSPLGQGLLLAASALLTNNMYGKDLWVVSKPCSAFHGRHWISILFKEGVVVEVLEGWYSP